MHSILLIGIGGFIGAILRYLISTGIQNGSETFPYGTLAVNIIGSFLLSMIMFASESYSFIDEKTRMFLTIGLLGAFTTMSTFSFETFKFIEKGQFNSLVIYISATIVLSIVAIYLSKIIVSTMNIIK